MRSSADDMRMTYVPADDVRMTYMPADDIPDDICHLAAKISNEVSLLCRPHVVCTRLLFPDHFKLNSRGQLC